MASRPDLRIGDADRESAASVLREHYAQGRLTLDEFNQRLDDTFAATTQRQLATITQDLPHLTPPAAAPPVKGEPRPRPWHPRVLPALGLLTALLVVSSVFLGRGDFFPGRIIVVLIVIAMVRGLLRGRYHHGGGPGGRYSRPDHYGQIHGHHHHHRRDRYDGPRFSDSRFRGPGGFGAPGGPRFGAPGGFGGPRLSRDPWGQ